jgi:hypothetical protein
LNPTPEEFELQRLKVRSSAAAAARIVATIVICATLLWVLWPLLFIPRISKALLSRWGWWRSTERELQGAGQARLRVERDAIVFEGERIATRDLVDGWIEPLADGRQVVVLELSRGRQLLAELGSAAEAGRLLESLGFAPKQHAARFPLASSLVASGAGPGAHLGLAYIMTCILGGFWVAPISAYQNSNIVGVVAMVALAAVVSFGAMRVARRAALRGNVVVGSDGFRLHQNRRERFVSYRDVRAVHTVTSKRGAYEVVVETTAGSERLPLGNMVDDERGLGEALAGRLRGALERYRARLPAADLALLDRKGRSLAAWRQDLAQLRDGHYREAAVDDPALVELLEDDAAPHERRVAAALSLLDTGDAQHREEVRRASDKSAHPRMRIALERALAGELDDATVEALAEAAAAEEEALAHGER